MLNHETIPALKAWHFTDTHQQPNQSPSISLNKFLELSRGQTCLILIDLWFTDPGYIQSLRSL